MDKKETNLNLKTNDEKKAYVLKCNKNERDNCFNIFFSRMDWEMIVWMISAFPKEFNVNKECEYAANWGNFKLCFLFLKTFKNKIYNETRLKIIRYLKFIVFELQLVFFENYLYFWKCCNELYDHFNGVCEKFVRFYAKLYKKKQLEAIKVIINWWIPICYNPENECGKRMMEKSWDNVQNLFKTHFSITEQM